MNTEKDIVITINNADRKLFAILAFTALLIGSTIITNACTAKPEPKTATETEIEAQQAAHAALMTKALTKLAIVNSNGDMDDKILGIMTYDQYLFACKEKDFKLVFPMQNGTPYNKTKFFKEYVMWQIPTNILKEIKGKQRADKISNKMSAMPAQVAIAQTAHTYGA